MFDFVFIFGSILEIALTAIIVVQIVKLEKRVIALNDTVVAYGALILELNKKLVNILSKINKVVEVISSKNFQTAKKVLRLTIDVVQIVLLVRSLDLSKGIRAINFKNVKKVIKAEIIKQLVKTFVFG